MTCDKCLAELEIGSLQFCPHGRSTLQVVSDSIPGGMILENLGPTPVRVDSHSDRRHLMALKGLTEKVRHTPLQGTDKSPHTTRWI